MANDGTIRGTDIIADEAFARIEKFDDKLAELLATIEKIQKAGQGANTNVQFNEAAQKANRATQEANTLLLEKERTLKAVERQQARNAIANDKATKQLAKERFETQQITRANKEATILTSRFADAYQKLALKVKIAKREFQNLVITQGENAAATRRAQREYETLSLKLTKADRIAGDFRRNVGNYPGALAPAIGALRQLIGVFGLYEGLRLSFSFAKEAIELSNQAKGVEFAFRRLGDRGVQAFNDIKNATRGALSNIEVKTAINDFENFNIDLEQTGILFEFLTVRARQTGRSIEDLQSSLVEGLSKESRLRIDNLGISLTELNEELKKTPNFVEAVANIAKREVAEAGDIIDAAANSQERLNASLINAKTSFGQLLQSGNLGFLKTLADQIDRIDRGFKFFTASLGFVRRGLDDFLRPIKQLLEQFPILNLFITRSVQFLGDFFKIITTPGIEALALLFIKLGATLSGLGNAFVAAKDATIDFFRTLASFGEIEFSLNPLENFRKAKEFFVKAKDQFIKGGKDVATAFSEGYAKAINFTPPKEKIQETKNVITELGETIDKLPPKIQKVANAFEESYKEAENLFEALKKTFEFAAGQGLDILPADQINSALEKMTEGLAAIETESQISAEKLKEIYRGVFETFSQYYGIDTSAFESLLATKEASLEDYVATSKSLINAIYESRQISYENEIRANQEKLNTILNNENATEEQKLIAKRKAEQEEKKIRIKQAKAEREAVLIQIAIDTAAAVAKVLAQTGVVAPLVIPGIIALGLAQAAFVAAQPLPQFFKGKGPFDDYEGPATWGEKRREVKIGSDGQVEVSPNKATPLWVKKDDIILKSLPDFHSAMRNPNSEAFKRVGATLQRDTAIRTGIITPQGYNGDGVERAIKRGFKGIRHDIKIINKWPDARLTKF